MPRTLKLHYKEAILDTDLAQFPVRELTFGVDPAEVVRLALPGSKLEDASAE